MGLMFGIIYGVYGLGLWFGVKIIKDEEGTEEYTSCSSNCTLDYLGDSDINGLLDCVEGCRRFSIGSITVALFGIVQGNVMNSSDSFTNFETTGLFFGLIRDQMALVEFVYSVNMFLTFFNQLFGNHLLIFLRISLSFERLKTKKISLAQKMCVIFQFATYKRDHNK